MNDQWFQEGDYLLEQLTKTFGNSEVERDDASSTTIFSATLDDIESFYPFEQPIERFRNLFPIVLAVGVRERADERMPSAMHHFFWPLWSNSPLYEIKDFEHNEKLIIWKCVEYIFVNMLDDDSYLSLIHI